MSICFWVNGPAVPDYATLPLADLLRVWHENRNSPVGIMAADEVCRRVARGGLSEVSCLPASTEPAARSSSRSPP